MFHSTDRGATWGDPTRVYPFTCEIAHAVDPNDADHLRSMTRTQRALLAGEDFDATVDRTGCPPDTPADHAVIYKNGLLIESTDGGRTYREVPGALTGYYEHRGTILWTRRNIVVVTHQGGDPGGHAPDGRLLARISLDGGRTWVDGSVGGTRRFNASMKFAIVPQELPTTSAPRPTRSTRPAARPSSDCCSKTIWAFPPFSCCGRSCRKMSGLTGTISNSRGRSGSWPEISIWATGRFSPCRSAVPAIFGDYAELCTREGFTLAGELHSGVAVDRSERALWLFDQVGCTSVGLHFDIVHCFVAGEGVEDSVRDLVPITAHTHVTDAHGQEDGSFDLVLLGHGELDSVAYVKAMHEAGWTGFITVEVSVRIWGREDYDLEEAARFSYRTLDNAFEKAGVPRG